jgi:hypothetical protein
LARLTPTPAQVEQVLARIPEGFITREAFGKRFQIHNKGQKNISIAVQAGKVGLHHNFLYDSERLTVEQVVKLSSWCAPSLPYVTNDGAVTGETILQQRQARLRKLEGDTVKLAILHKLSPDGYATLEQFTNEANVLMEMVREKMLEIEQHYVYDPLQLSRTSIQRVCHLDTLRSTHTQLLQYLKEEPGQTTQLDTLRQKYPDLKDLMRMGGVVKFSVPYIKGFVSEWVRLEEGDAAAAEEVAKKYVSDQLAEKRKAIEDEWKELLKVTGDVVRPEAREGKSPRMKVVAHSYTFPQAAKRLRVREETLEQAVKQEKIISFTDPDQRRRFSAADIERAVNDPDYGMQITGFEVLKARDIALVCGVHYSTIRRRLDKAGINRLRPTWGEVHGRWELPDTLQDYKDRLRERYQEWREERQKAYERAQAELRVLEEERRRKREELRQQLIAVFPTWQREDRVDQRVILHVGPTNSGKTYHALQRLSAAGSGWYLAPLRLLAFEVFDRLNAQGTLCSLLTGEEYIPVPGATITAATIEMFNPLQSGACVVIDEAHMLADADRGGAWTRALMEAQAQEIYVLGSPVIRKLVERFSRIIALPFEVVEYSRLTPLRVAQHPWSLGGLPAKTLLIAFSRKMVLGLKRELERMGRKVSVVYGSLPPEVRRRQADRFASGDTDICVATDAVGMGLNLPADHVCFYEVEKFDGRESRELTVHELHQIGGRAGRYGLSGEGIIGALTPPDLGTVRRLYETTPPTLSHARVAPTIKALSLIEGTLAERLREWSLLQSIPDELRSVLKTVDLDERIELAEMLEEHEVNQLGLKSALQLVNAPTRPSTRAYWRDCVTQILRARPMPFPPLPPKNIKDNQDLEYTETCILSADVYLWLSQRHEFMSFAPESELVRAERAEWSMRVDDALNRAVDVSRRCARCGKKMPFNHRHSICDDCYHGFRYEDEYYYEPRRKKEKPPQYEPVESDSCPLCREETGTAAQTRLAHWREKHPDRDELSVTYAAWVMNQTKETLRERIPFDRKAQEGTTSVRLWSIKTLEKVIDEKATPASTLRNLTEG